MPNVAFIIPFVNEYPLICTTIRSIGEAMKGSGIDFEVVPVDNWHEDVEAQHGKDRGHTLVKGLAPKNTWIKVAEYHDKLSHWNAKNYGGAQTDAEFLMFIDAHCIAPYQTLPDMVRAYMSKWKQLNGSLHLPLTYHFLEEKRLIYAMRHRPEIGDLDYKFVRARAADEIYEVPCMSTCGMLIHRSFLDQLGWWPAELGIYGGGEHFLNYAMGVTGMTKHIFKQSPLYHHGEKRGYNWNGWDYARNRLIAIFMWGGEAKMASWIEGKKEANKRSLHKLRERLVKNKNLIEQKERIALLAKMSIDDFVEKWSNHAT